LDHTVVTQPAFRIKTERRLFVYLFKPMMEERMSNRMCVECGAEITIPGDVMQNEIVPCPECCSELEVISLEPFAMALAPEVEEDWGE
jgi:alpha-aminoadipate/glutamate carrier protein LysW